MGIFPKLTREELKREEQRLTKSRKVQLLMLPVVAGVAGILVVAVNYYAGTRFGAIDFFFLMCLSSSNFFSDWFQLRSIRNKLNQL